jgi:hypothetical protein
MVSALSDVHLLRWIALLLLIGIVVLFNGWALKTLFASAHRCNRLSFCLWVVMYLLVIFFIPAFVVGYAGERVIASSSADGTDGLRAARFVITMLWLLPTFLLAQRYAKRFPPPSQSRANEV